MKIGIIGVGKLGEFHTKLIAEIASEQTAVECAGVFDLKHRARRRDGREIRRPLPRIPRRPY